MMPAEFPGSSLEPDCHSCPVCSEVKGGLTNTGKPPLTPQICAGGKKTLVGVQHRLLGSRVKEVFLFFLPSLTTASAVWCGRPVNTWTAGAPPRCRHTFPRYPGPSCTPAMILLGLLATPEGKRRREKQREAGIGVPLFFFCRVFVGCI